jgi:hypothetical protein
MTINERAWAFETLTICLGGLNRLYSKLLPFDMMVTYLLYGGRMQFYPRAAAVSHQRSTHWGEEGFANLWRIDEAEMYKALSESIDKPIEDVQRRLRGTIESEMRTQRGRMQRREVDLSEDDDSDEEEMDEVSLVEEAIVEVDEEDNEGMSELEFTGVRPSRSE